MTTYTAFANGLWLATGSRDEVVKTLRVMPHMPRASDILVFDNETGRQIDFDLRETDQTAQPSGRGRPRLGVKAGEVTLLPRHWDWLKGQPGGASAALRRMVDAAMKQPRSAEAGRDAAYAFLSAIAGDYPGFEEAIRALYQNDRARFEAVAAPWPPAISGHAVGLAWDSVVSPASSAP